MAKTVYYQQPPMNRLVFAISRLVGFAVLFFAIGVAAGWVESAQNATPGAYGFPGGTHENDSRLTLALLEQVLQSFKNDVTSWRDLPIFFPASGQLLGSEHFWSAQLIYAPIRSVVRSPLVAANLALLGCYILAAFFMERFLRALGTDGGLSFLGGVVFALGPLYSAPHLQLFQYQSFYLPWLALGLHRLRDNPDLRRAPEVFIALLLGSLSSFYMAALLAFLGATWTLLELARKPSHRLQFLTAAFLAASLAAFVSAWLQQDWFAARSAIGVNTAQNLEVGLMTAEARGEEFWSLRLSAIHEYLGWPVVLGSMVGAFQVGASRPGTRFAARAGLTMVVLGLLLVPGLYIGEFRAPSLLDAFHLALPGLFRVPDRCLLIVGFGTAILVVAGLGSVSRFLFSRFTAGLAATALVALGLLLAGERTYKAMQAPMDRFAPFGAQKEVYSEVARIVAEHPGPLLEVPYRGLTWSNAPDSMLGQLHHGMPILTGHTGYFPRHHDQLLALLEAVPEPSALRGLVRLSGMKWLLLRADPAWPKRPKFFAQKIPPEWIRTHAEIQGWHLYEIDIPELQAPWQDYVAGPPSSSTSPLGTPLREIQLARANLEAKADYPAWFTDSELRVEVRLVNLGQQGWAARSQPGEPEEWVVRFFAAWTSRQTGLLERVELPLLHDVGSGESANFVLRVPTPATPGLYTLEIGLEQLGSDAFSSIEPARISNRFRLVETPDRQAGD